MKKNILKIIALFIIGMIGGIFGEQIFWPYFVEKPLFYKYELDKQPLNITERKEIIIQENTALKKAIEKVEKSVVGIETKTSGGKIIKGSGLVISSDGLIVTLSEILPQGGNFKFLVDGEISNYKVIKRDTSKNLVLVKLEKNNLSSLPFYNFEDLKLGERVFLLALKIDNNGYQKIVNEGIIRNFDDNFIQTNIFEKLEVKGSPLFDIEGKVIGLNTINSDGMILTIPSKTLKEFIGL